MTTKKKVILTFIGMAVCIATLLLVFFSGEKLRGGKDTEANTDPPTSDMQPVSDEVEKDDDNSAASQEMKNQELICKGWFLPSNTYDCGSFVVN